MSGSLFVCLGIRHAHSRHLWRLRETLQGARSRRRQKDAVSGVQDGYLYPGYRCECRANSAPGSLWPCSAVIGIVCLVGICVLGLGGIVAFVYGWIKARDWEIVPVMAIWSGAIALNIVIAVAQALMTG